MDLEKIGEGRLAEIFSWGDGQALQLCRSPDHDWAAAEAEATEAVHRAGVPAPRCYGTIEIDSRTGLILDRLSGSVLGDVMFGDDSDAALYGLGRLQCRDPRLPRRRLRLVAVATRASDRRHLAGRHGCSGPRAHGRPSPMGTPCSIPISTRTT